MYKSQLQEYAQKASIRAPVYEFVKEGASHEPRFKAMVILNNVTYESPPGFPNLKSAEHAAAKAALDVLSQSNGGTGVLPSPVHESGLCKNLLQEYAQKNCLPLPVYQSQRSGEDHAPTFTSSVEIAGVRYSGGSAKNKKEAEIKAARTALLAIQSAKTSPFPAHQPQVVQAPAAPVAPAPVGPAPVGPAPVGLATLISAHLNNAPGKKRGRGVADGNADEPNAGRLKTGSQDVQGHVDVEEKGAIPTSSPMETQSVTNLVTPSVPEVQDSPVTSSVAPSVVTADMFATPGAKKILGDISLTPQGTPTLEHSLGVQHMEQGPDSQQTPHAEAPQMQPSPQTFEAPEEQHSPQALQSPSLQQSPQPLQVPEMQQSPQPVQVEELQQSPEPLQAAEMQETLQQPLDASQLQENSQLLQAPESQQIPECVQTPPSQHIAELVQDPLSQPIPELFESPQMEPSAQEPVSLIQQDSPSLQVFEMPSSPHALLSETSDVLFVDETSLMPSPQILKKESTFVVTNSATGMSEEIVVTQDVLAVDSASDRPTTLQNSTGELDCGATQVHG